MYFNFWIDCTLCCMLYYITKNNCYDTLSIFLYIGKSAMNAKCSVIVVILTSYSVLTSIWREVQLHYLMYCMSNQVLYKILYVITKCTATLFKKCMLTICFIVINKNTFSGYQPSVYLNSSVWGAPYCFRYIYENCINIYIYQLGLHQ